MASINVRLAYRPFYWRLFALLFVLGELLVWASLKPLAFGPARKVFVLFVYAPSLLFTSMMLALGATALADLFVRLVIGPQVRHWLHPRNDPDSPSETSIAFHLAPGEKVLTESPGRRISGRSATPGVLVRTDRKVWFLPRSWNLEPWSIPLNEVRKTRAVPSPRLAWNLILGLPDRLVIVGGPGVQEVFAVAEPERIFTWFEKEPTSERKLEQLYVAEDPNDWDSPTPI